MYTRIYFEGGGTDQARYIIGDERSDTIGGQKLIGLEYDRRTGLTVHFKDYDSYVPAHWVKVSWKRPAL